MGIDNLAPCRDLPRASMAEQAYGRFLEFDAIRAHLRLSNDEQLAQRLNMVDKYMHWCLNLRKGSIDRYVSYLDSVAAAHQRGLSRIPCLHLLMGLAITHDVILRRLS